MTPSTSVVFYASDVELFLVGTGAQMPKLTENWSGAVSGKGVVGLGDCRAPPD